MTAVDNSNLLSRVVAANKHLLGSAAVEESRQLLHSMGIQSKRHMDLHSLQNPAVDSVLVRLVRILTKRSGKHVELETQNALHSVVPHPAAERRSGRLLTSFHSAQDLVSAVESTDWRPVLRHWESKHVTAVAS